MSINPNAKSEKAKNLAKCETCMGRTIGWGLIANFFLAGFKLFVGFLGRSHALIGSGLCNLSDTTSSIAVIIGVKYSKKAANPMYPYGYGKVEFITQVLISCFMILGTVSLIFSSFITIAKRAFVVPHMVVFFVAILSAIINAMLYKFSHCGSKELNSPVLKAHAEHNKIDVISSLLVAIGILVTRKGMHWVDPAIAIFECAHVIHASVLILIEGLKSTMDTNLPVEFRDEIKTHIMQVDGVRKVNTVKARQTGRMIILDIVLELNPELNTLQAKMINQKIKSLLRGVNKYIGHVALQVVPAEI